MPIARLLPAAIVALLLTWLQVCSGNDSYATVVPAVAALAYVTIASGRLLLAASGERVADPAPAWALGLLGVCLAVYALSAVFVLTAAAAFGIVAVAVLVLDVLLWRKAGEPALDRAALAAFALCVAFTAAWCSGPARAYAVLQAQDMLPVWSDHFVHAGLLAQFGDPHALGRGSIYLADYPPTFYHFASYFPAAALVRLLDQPGLELSASAWLPLGFLAMLCGAYALGARLAGAAGGIAALAVVAILPDSSNYGLRNGLFSFHWTLFASPGTTYALAAVFLSLVLLEQWSTTRRLPALLLGAALAGTILLFRAHLFFLFLPAWLASAAYCLAPSAKRYRIGAALAAGLGAAAVAISAVLTELHASEPEFWRFGERALGNFLAQVHNAQEPTAYTGLYAELAWGDYPSLTFAVGIGLVIVAALGVFTVLLPAAMVLARRCGVLRPLDVFPAFALYAWLLFMLFAPEPWHGDSTDLIHRPFVIVYAAGGIWTFCLALRCLAAWQPRLAPRSWPALLAGALLALPAIAVGADALARPKFAWGAAYVTQRVPPGLVQAAAFLRREAAVGEIFAAAGLTEAQAFFDLPMQLCALSGVPTYLSRPYYEMIKEPRRKSEVTARLAALRAIERQTDYRAAMEALRSLKVRWYVTSERDGPLWDPSRQRAAFTAGTVALYRTP